YDANIEAKHLIEQIIVDEEIECHYTNEDAYLYTNQHDETKKIEDEFAAYKKLTIEINIETILANKIPVKKALKMTNQAHFHPVKYSKKLIETCLDNGVEFFANTRALNIEFTSKASVITNNGRVFANYIIQASHYPFYDGLGFYPTRMYASRAYIIAVKTEE